MRKEEGCNEETKFASMSAELTSPQFPPALRNDTDALPPFLSLSAPDSEVGVKICNICSGEHHARVCAMNQKEDVNHLATVKDCPILIKEAEEEALKATSHIYG